MCVSLTLNSQMTIPRTLLGKMANMAAMTVKKAKGPTCNQRGHRPVDVGDSRVHPALGGLGERRQGVFEFFDQLSTRQSE